ncbi:hypothetical protein SEUCBS139899_000954 [Sporothrix eucalyptigena]|uniref:Uncharacterized protein n=1 Tax=Sporothrix eucalyptigena TaxID=1812306 RepID=A0ABP0BJ87_9PEZI
MTPPQTEILVHVAAASRASDDARYRALAQAYAEFQPDRRLDVSVRSGGRGIAGNATPAVLSFEEYRQPASSVIQITNGSNNGGGRSFQFTNLSFESIWDNLNSPALPKAVAGLPPSKAPPAHIDRHHYVSPDDYIPDSQPDNETESQQTSSKCESEQNEVETRICREASPDLSVMPMEQINDTNDESQDQQSLYLPRKPLSQRSANSQRSSQNDGVYGGGSFKSSPPLHEWNADPSSIAGASLDSGNGQPTSYVDIPSSLLEESGKVFLRMEASSHEPCGLLESLSSSTALEPLRADSEPARTKRQRSLDIIAGASRRRASDVGQPLAKKKRNVVNTRPLADITKEKADEAVVEDIPFNNVFRTLTQSFPSSSPTASAPGLYHDQSLRIISPEPPVACEKLDAAALITEKMAKLAQDLDIERRYRPLPPSREDKKEGRPVRPFERGYWRLNTSGWPVAMRHQAWSFLTNYIGAGDAGWSVWCSRDPAPHTWLKLHCFAATAGHTYLILYLASQRQILATGAEWLDGAGSPVITVPPRKKRQAIGGVDVFTTEY